MRILALTALLMAALPAQAASLRAMATLQGPYVFLRDLFDDAGPNADRILGPGPGPGGRIIVGAAQLGAIARQFSVEWRPTSNADRAVLEWPGRPMRREDALDAVRTALIAAGAVADCVIETMAKEEFLMLPHPVVRDYMQRKVSNIDRWLEGMNRWRAKKGPAQRNA